MSANHVLRTIQCPESRHVVAQALDNGWEWLGFTKSGHGQLRWPATGQVIPFAATPSDRRYAWRQLARRIKLVSGLDFTGNGGTNRRRSRKNPNNVVDLQVEASRRRYQRQQEAATAAAQSTSDERELAQVRQAQAAARAAVEETRRREIESLMRPGWGH